MDDARLAEIEAYARTMCYGKPSVLAEDMVPELIAEIRRLRAALLTARGYAADIEADATTSLPSLRASLIQETVDRTLGTYPNITKSS